jgi:hypothetical protein
VDRLATHKPRRRPLNTKIISSNIFEAYDELSHLLQRLQTGTLNEPELQVGLRHAYHHLNFAWNIRRVPTSRRKSLRNGGSIPPISTRTESTRSLRSSAPKTVASAVLKDESDGFGQACSRFVPGVSLAVGARDFGAIGDIPIIVALKDRGKFVVHSP